MLGFLRFLTGLGLLAVIGGGVFLWITAPARLDPDLQSELARATGDPVSGEQVFLAAGCASCHAAPDAEGDEKLVLAGGQGFPSDFGTFRAPNISPDPVHGIGDWDLASFARAVTEGVSPEGQHYYPAFPYTAYAKMTAADIADLKSYMDTLPASDAASQPHEVGFPFNIRRTLGGWKFLFMTDTWAMPDVPDGSIEADGRYLVEALSHCGECHTPRNALGGLDVTRWLGGAPNPDGKGQVPNITPGKLSWSAGDIAYYLESGFTPDYDSAGGHMVEVVNNYAQLSPENRAAVAAYLKAVPAVE